MRLLSTFVLFLVLQSTTAFAAGDGKKESNRLTISESFKTSYATIYSTLVVLGLTNFSTADVSDLMVKIYRNDDTLESFAEKAGCSNLPPNACICTNEAAIFDQYVAPAFAAETKSHPDELFQEREATVNGYAFKLQFDRTPKMRFKILVNGSERGKKKSQQFCNFNGKFKLFTETNGGKFIGVNVISIGEALRQNKPLGIGFVGVANGEISYRD